MDATTQLATTQLIDHEAGVIWFTPLRTIPTITAMTLVVVEDKGRCSDAGAELWLLSTASPGLLWNVNVGHGRGELADAAAAQMRRIAFASAYIGATNGVAICGSPKRSSACAFTPIPPRSISPPPAPRSNGSAFKIRPLLLEDQGPAGQDQDHLAHPRLSRE